MRIGTNAKVGLSYTGPVFGDVSDNGIKADLHLDIDGGPARHREVTAADAVLAGTAPPEHEVIRCASC